jgi:transposase
MALGRRKPPQQPLWVANGELPRSPGHPFYAALNRLLAEADFDRFVEQLCASYYADNVGRPGIAPGVYFRMLLVGYFEGLGSQRGIAWRCSDSLSLREFLGLSPSQPSPDHSSLTVIRQRLPLEVHEQVFVAVLAIARQKKLLKGKTVAVDSTTLEANAAMKGIVHKHSGEDWKKYLKRLAEEAGVVNPTQADLNRFDRGRRHKRVSNQEWCSPTDPDSRIARMKDGRTRLAYKAEHVIDLESDLILAATVQTATCSDAETLPESLLTAQASLVMSGSETAIAEIVADKGYHKAETLAECEAWDVRTYIPSRREPHHRRWTDKPPAWQAAYRANARRVQGARGKRLSRLRSELPERSFAHVCGTGGARRTWIRGLTEVGKRHVIAATARNLSVIMRALYGIGTARSLQGAAGALQRPQTALVRAAHRVLVLVSAVITSLVYHPKIRRSWLPAPLAA